MKVGDKVKWIAPDRHAVIDGRTRQQSASWDTALGRNGTVVSVIRLNDRPIIFVRPDLPNYGEFPCTESELEEVTDEMQNRLC